MRDFIKIGLIQPIIDPTIAWNVTAPYGLNVDSITAARVWSDIQEGLRLMLKGENKPDIILIPELHLPVSRIGEIKEISRKNNVMIIAGVDFQRNTLIRTNIRNRGVLTIPNNFDKDQLSTRVTTLQFGKTYFTHMERSMFYNIEGEKCAEDQEQNMYLFKSKTFGTFGIMICSDIFDIERMMLYQTRIHHLFIISLNKDLNTYFSMAETLTRLLYCNVVICNTGHYGGSVALSPYEDVNNRLIYKYQGQKMFNINIVSIPVKSLDEAQKFPFAKKDKKKAGIKFKTSPPGYYDKIIGLPELSRSQEEINL